MTESESIKELQDNIDLPFGVTVSDRASRMAIQAIEKQIPRKPKTDDRYIMYICPCCNDFVKVSHNYCPKCCQKLDWSDEE